MFKDPSRPHRPKHPVVRVLGTLLAIGAGVVLVPLSADGQSSARHDLLTGSPTPGSRNRLVSLANDIHAIIGDRSFADATWGISVVSCESGEILFNHAGALNRQVASNLKLVSTSAALSVLGGDHRFATELYLGDVLDDSPAGNDLIIRTLGDPSISPSFSCDPRAVLSEWCRLLDSLGVRQLRNIVVDASRYDDVPYGPGWAWDDEPYGFNAVTSAAAIYDNAVEIRIAPGAAAGDPVRVDLLPPTAYVSIQVTAQTAPADVTSTIDVRRDRGSDVVTVSGSIALGAEPYVEHIAVEDPPLFFGTLVAEELDRRQIDVRGVVLDATDVKRPLPYSSIRRIAVRRSPPLRVLCAAVNKQSLNLAAEMITKELGYADCGIGSTAAGLDAIRRFVVSLGIDPERTRILDGSGLSRLSMISANDITHLLRTAWRSSWGDDLRNSLSIAGRDGTLAGRMKGSLAEGNVMAKTGYLNGIRAISGYVRSRDGEWLTFSLVTNNYSVPTSVVNTAQDLILMRLASFTRKTL